MDSAAAFHASPLPPSSANSASDGGGASGMNGVVADHSGSSSATSSSASPSSTSGLNHLLTLSQAQSDLQANMEDVMKVISDLDEDFSSASVTANDTEDADEAAAAEATDTDAAAAAVASTATSSETVSDSVEAAVDSADFLDGRTDSKEEEEEEDEEEEEASLVESLTSVQEVSQVVDKAVLAREKLLLLSSRQDDIEQRFQHLSRRLNLLRCRHLGNFIVEEISTARSFCHSVAPPPPPTVPKINPFAMGVIHPPANVPDGIVLPSVPSAEVLLPTTQAVANQSGIKFKVEEGVEGGKVDVGGGGSGYRSRATASSAAAVALSSREKDKAQEVLGQVENHLKHLIQTYDSEATDSSSGGESCDEMDNFSTENSHYVPIKRRAKWTWLCKRANLASKWTWLTAQISDLEYRIRQQTEFYRQIRAAKGAVTLGEPVVSWPPHAKKPVQGSARQDQEVPLSCVPAIRDYSRVVDSAGKKIVIKEPSTASSSASTTGMAEATSTPALGPSSSTVADPDDNSFGACRTRPVKLIRRRRILPTGGHFLHKSAVRTSKESSVRCDCIHPNFWCAICFGKSNHTQVPDPVTQERNQCIGLLDHSYHQVLSTRHDVSLQLQMMQLLKSRSWLANSGSFLNQSIKEAVGGTSGKKKSKKPKKDAEDGERVEDGSGNKVSKSKKKGGGGGGNSGGKKRDKDGKLKKVKHKSESGGGGASSSKRRKSVSVHHHSDDRGIAMLDLSSDGDTMSGIDGISPVPSPSVPASNQAWADHIRRKRETAFDIDNIVIPYSIASATRVEKLKYKEILTPTWRQIKDEEEEAQQEQVAEVAEKENVKEEEVVKDVVEPSNSEDISEPVIEVRHAKAEAEEQKRWQLPLWKTSGGQRSRSGRRQDSCRTEASSGCNTPDPLSPGMVDKVDTLEVTTRPSTPINVFSEDPSTPTTAASSSQSAGSIQYRRRTSSVTKSRDRNPSEDTQSSRCTTPTAEQQQQFQHRVIEMLPFECRSFPLGEEDYGRMLEDMPDGHEFPPVLVDGCGVGDGDDIVMVPVPKDPLEDETASPAAAATKTLDPLFTQEGVSSAVFSPSSSAEEEEDTDPDWNGDMEEDPEDPEWNDKEDGAHGKTAGASGGSKAGGVGGGASGHRKGLPPLKMPKQA